MYAVSFNNVLKRYSTGEEMKVIFNGLNLTVNEGEFIVITGEQNSGKSLLLQMIAAMTPPNKGTVEVLNKDLLTIEQRTEWRLNNIGYITEEGCLVPYLTVKQNLLLGTPKDSPDYPTKVHQAEQILLDLGFSTEKINETYEGLSNKEQLLATIARIFMTNPKLILADDPTKKLCGEDGEDVLKQLFRFIKRKGSTTIMTSNDPIIMEAADRTFILDDCQLSEQSQAAN